VSATTPVPGHEPPILRVASFNIRNGIAWDGLDSWPLRRPATAATIAGLDADLLGLQEVYGFQQRYLLRRLPGYAATGAGRTDGRSRGERCAVLTASARSFPALICGIAVVCSMNMTGTRPDRTSGSAAESALYGT